MKEKIKETARELVRTFDTFISEVEEAEGARYDSNYQTFIFKVPKGSKMKFGFLAMTKK